MPGWRETPADPVLWGALVAVGIMAVGHRRPGAVPLHEQ
jgi:hypothetical protein